MTKTEIIEAIRTASEQNISIEEYHDAFVTMVALVHLATDEQISAAWADVDYTV